MKTYIIHTIDSNGIAGKCYTNEYELAVINWLIQHKYIIKRIDQ